MNITNNEDATANLAVNPSREWRMRAVHFLVAALVSTLYVTVVGMLSILANAMMAGAVVDLTNNLVAVREPGVPWFYYLAVGVATALVLLLFRLLMIRASTPTHGRQTAWVATAATAALVIVPMVATIAPYQSGVGSSLPAVLAFLQAGAFSPAVHVCLVLFAALLCADERKARAARADR